MKSLLYTILSLLIPAAIFAQQLPQFTQYMYNTIAINPAYAGSREAFSAVALHRSQWTGLEGGPRTLTMSVHSPLRNDRIGVGLSFIHDQLGFENFSYVYGDFAYRIQTGTDTWLSLGLKAGITQFRLDDALLNDPDVVNDPFFRDASNRISPNIGAGVFWRSYRWYIGLSSPRIFNSDYISSGIGDNEFIAAERSSYYFTGGYVFDLSANIQMKPAFLIKGTRGAELSYDTTVNFLFYDKLWLGVNYRVDDSMGGIADVRITPQLRIGYAYDYPISGIRPYSSGTHEIILLFDFALNPTKYKSPRYF